MTFFKLSNFLLKLQDFSSKCSDFDSFFSKTFCRFSWAKLLLAISNLWFNYFLSFCLFLKSIYLLCSSLAILVVSISSFSFNHFFFCCSAICSLIKLLCFLKVKIKKRNQNKTHFLTSRLRILMSLWGNSVLLRSSSILK